MFDNVIFINNIAFPKYYEEGLVEDISPYFKDELANGVFFEKAVENFKREGRLYAVPRDISNIVIFYNKTLLQKNGIKEPKEDWSLDEL